MSFIFLSKDRRNLFVKWDFNDDQIIIWHSFYLHRNLVIPKGLQTHVCRFCWYCMDTVRSGNHYVALENYASSHKHENSFIMLDCTLTFCSDCSHFLIIDDFGQSTIQLHLHLVTRTRYFSFPIIIFAIIKWCMFEYLHNEIKFCNKKTAIQQPPSVPARPTWAHRLKTTDVFYDVK